MYHKFRDRDRLYVTFPCILLKSPLKSRDPRNTSPERPLVAASGIELTWEKREALPDTVTSLQQKCQY